jgi:hypothetical protein
LTPGLDGSECKSHLSRAAHIDRRAVDHQASACAVRFGVAGSVTKPGCGSCRDLPLFLELAVCAAALQPKIREVFL